MKPYNWYQTNLAEIPKGSVQWEDWMKDGSRTLQEMSHSAVFPVFRLYTYTFLALSTAAQLQAQGEVTIEFNNSTLVLPASAVDLMQSDTVLQRVSLSYGASGNSIVTSDTISPSVVDLANEKPQSFNVLNTFSLEKSANQGLKENISVELGAQQSVTIVLPYLLGSNSFVPTFKTTGSHIFIDGKLWQVGNSVDFSSPVQVKVVAFNGDIRTYSIQSASLACLMWY